MSIPGTRYHNTVQVGLLAYGCSGCFAFSSGMFAEKWLLEAASPITAAGPRWNLTTFPVLASQQAPEPCFT